MPLWLEILATYAIGDPVLYEYRPDAPWRPAVITAVVEYGDEIRYTIRQDDGLVVNPVHSKYLSPAWKEDP